jgi:hypothetical protein
MMKDRWLVRVGDFSILLAVCGSKRDWQVLFVRRLFAGN